MSAADKKKPTYIEVRVGSDSDLPKIAGVFKALDSLDISYAPRILSAHRTPTQMASEAKKLEENGFRVCIAAAGGSAHLAGMTASETLQPVVALPVQSALGGTESLLSMAQMPPGIPNGCVGVGAGESAAHLAARIAFFADPSLRKTLASNLGKQLADKTLPSKPAIHLLAKDEASATAAKQLASRFGIETMESGPLSSFAPVVALLPLAELPATQTDYLCIASPPALPSGGWPQLQADMAENPDAAVVGVGRAQNAILFAAQVLALHYPAIKKHLQTYRQDMANAVIEKDKKLCSAASVEQFLSSSS